MAAREDKQDTVSVPDQDMAAFKSVYYTTRPDISLASGFGILISNTFQIYILLSELAFDEAADYLVVFFDLNFPSMDLVAGTAKALEKSLVVEETSA